MSTRSPLSMHDLERAFALHGFDPVPHQRAMAPRHRRIPPSGDDVEPPRDASALAYVFVREDRLLLPLTLRRKDLREHRGQVSLPGGRPEAGESSFETALREAHEEVGLDRELPTEVGRLHPVYIPVTHTYLHVHVATGPDPGDLIADPREVEEIRLTELDPLVAPDGRTIERWTIRGEEIDVPFFPLAGWSVWGATAIALGELAGRLDAALDATS